jgi:hypothetical protein
MPKANVQGLDGNTDSFQGTGMGEQREVKRRIHSIKYIYQMMEWGFSKEFIARDMGVHLDSLEIRLKRHQEREQNGKNRKGKS